MPAESSAKQRARCREHEQRATRGEQRPVVQHRGQGEQREAGDGARHRHGELAEADHAEQRARGRREHDGDEPDAQQPSAPAGWKRLAVAVRRRRATIRPPVTPIRAASTTVPSPADSARAPTVHHSPPRSGSRKGTAGRVASTIATGDARTARSRVHPESQRLQRRYRVSRLWRTCMR